MPNKIMKRMIGKYRFRGATPFAAAMALIVSAMILCGGSAPVSAQSAGSPSGLQVGGAHYSNRECLSCHSTKIKSKKLKRTMRPVDPDLFANTPHKKFTCVDCHSTAVLAAKPKTHMTAIERVDCRQCHYKNNKEHAPDVAEEYARGIHGQQWLDKDNPDVPFCKDCHGFHDIRKPSDPDSKVNRLRIPHTCGKCHGNHKLMREYKIPVDIYTNYRKSVHGKGVLRMGLTVTAVCIDCHGNHDIRTPLDPDALINRKNVPKLCGKCHLGVYRVYRKSIHGKMWIKGNKDVPVCTDCHGEHSIDAPDEDSSRVNPANVGNTCTKKCHDRMKLARKYKLPLNRLESFEKSYHGTAIQLNAISVANCASCHGTHDILPSSDPDSMVSEKNLPRTCGRCHPEAKKNMNIGKVHVEDEEGSDMILRIIRLAYVGIILGSVGGFLFYILVDLYGHRRRKRMGDKH